MKEHLLDVGNLLNNKQEVIEAGYAFSPVKRFNKEVIKKHKIKFKEWDYYYFGNEKYAFAVVIGDLRYAGQYGIVYFDFTKKELLDRSQMLILPNGKTNLPPDSESDWEYKNKNIYLKMEIKDELTRHLIVKFPKFKDNKDLNVDVDIIKTTKDSMVIVTPFFKDRHFYYNEKKNNLKCVGNVLLGDENLNINNDFVGVLDWGRGIWTFNNTWHWCSINTKYNDDYVGFNIGNGFGDTSKASENMFFLNEKAYKLGQVDIKHTFKKNGKLDTTGKITIDSIKNDELHIEFIPTFNRHVNLNFLVISQLTDQMFGHFSGYVKYEGKTYEFKDLFGFIERVKNRW